MSLKKLRGIMNSNYKKNITINEQYFISEYNETAALICGKELLK